MLYDKLKKYAESEVYPFHMPGHKRQDIYGDGIIPYNIDLTEIYDFDNLHSPNGCIKEIEEKAAQIYVSAISGSSRISSRSIIRARISRRTWSRSAPSG